MNIIFFGTPTFVQSIKSELAKNFQLTESLEDSDLAVVAAYGKIFTKKELEIPKYGFLNIHPSLLPKYRGPSPIQAALLNGDKISGITIIEMDEKVDHGPIIYQEELAISDSDNFHTLSKKMFLKASKILPGIINDFVSGKIKPVGQNHAKSSFCQFIKKQDGYFKIDTPPSSDKLDRMIRAYYPWPGVWTYWEVQSAKGKVKRVVKLLPAPLSSQLASRSERMSGSIKFLLQMEGKKAIPWKDFLNGYPDFPMSKALASQ